MFKKKTIGILAFLLVAVLFTGSANVSARALRTGNRGSAVTSLQTQLRDAGYNPGKIDGSFGGQTRAAVIKFQRDKGLAVDGIAGPATQSKLNSLGGSVAPVKPAGPTAVVTKPVAKPGSPIAITQTLRQGSRGGQVKVLQEKLNQLAFNAGAVDGSFGRGTRAAVIRFQAANGLSRDGIFGPASRTKIASLISPPVAPTPVAPKPVAPAKPVVVQPTIPITQTLRQGSRGNQVKLLQQRLNELGFKAGAVDGSFGKGTKAAVIRFQAANGLARDGIVGPASRAKLYPPVIVVPEPVAPKPVAPKPVAPKPVAPKPVEPAKPENTFNQFNGSKGALTGKTVILDAGHGGKDPGAVNGKTYEKDLNLDMAKRLERMLKQAGAKVVMTRTNDSYSYLYYRSAFINKYIVEQEIGSQTILLKNKSDLATEIVEKEKELKAYELDRVDKKEAIQGINFDLIDKQVMIDSQKEKLIVLKEGLQDLLLKVENIKEKKEIVVEKEIDISQMKIDLETFKEEYPDLVDEIKEAEEAILEQEGLLIPIKEEILKLEKELQDIEDLEKKQENYANEEKILDGYQEKLENLNTSKTGLDKELVEIDLKIKNASTEKAQLKSKNILLDSEIKSLKYPIKDLRNQKELLGQVPPYQDKRPYNPYLKKIFDLSKEKYEDDTIFVSIHCNSGGRGQASGVQVYYTNNNTNPTYYKGYNDGKRLKLANSMLKNTKATTSFSGNWANPISRNLHVIREQNLPSVLMEIGFMDNPRDIALLRTQQTRENASKGMYLGIVEYFK